MAVLHSLSVLLDQQIERQEKLSEYLAKAKALSVVALGEDFLNYEKRIIHDFLGEISDLISEAFSLSESQLNTLLQNKAPIVF